MTTVLGETYDGAGKASGSNENGTVGNGDMGISTTDFNAVRGYLAALLPPVMTASRSDLERSLFSDENFHTKISRFAMDAGVSVCWFMKEKEAGRDDEGAGGEGGGQDETSSDAATRFSYSLHLPPVPPHSPNVLTTLSLIKSSHSLDLAQPLGSQLHVVVLSSPGAALPAKGISNGDGTAATPSGEANQVQSQTHSLTAAPYEGLHSIVHYGVTPWFESYVNSRTKVKSATIDGISSSSHGTSAGGAGVGGAGKSIGKGSAAEQQMGIPVAQTKRKFAELELSLLHLQQNVEIPEPVLVIQGSIQAAVDQCRASGSRVNVDAIQPSSLLSDTPFLNRLQADVNLWIRSIQAVTKLNRDVASGTASQEVNFWLSKERALEAIDAQLNGPAVLLVLDTLKAAKRYHATTSFLADTGLRESQEEATKYNALMRDFPLNELLSATDFDKIRESVFLIFAHVNKKLRVSPYPLRRALPLVEAISSDFNDQSLKVLGNQRMMHMDYAMFGRTMQAVMDMFGVWEENIKDFTNVAREVMRKRSERFIPVKINSAHTKTQERLTYLMAFRKSHEQLQAMTGPGGGLRSLSTEGMTDIDMEAEVKRAYELIKNVDVLDTSTDGTEIWISAENSYNDRVARVENQIISALRDKLATARNAHEMFKAFSKFNSLFVRPKIRGAVQEYQTRLIDSVKADIKVLQMKFTDNYRNSEAFRMSQLRDMPPVASAITWARQIERQLTLSMKRVEDVLGSGWELYAEGEKLKMESDAFRNKLDVRPIYTAWVDDVNRADPKISGRLLEIQRQRGVQPFADGSFPLELAVNFDPGAITLFKEVRNLLWLNFPVPHTIITYAKDAKKAYPHAVSLIEAVRAYNHTCQIIDKSESIASLIAGHRLRIQNLVVQGLQLRWEDISFSLSTARSAGNVPGDRLEDPAIAFFRDFAHSVSELQDKTALLQEIDQGVENDLQNIRDCPYDYDSFASALSALQAKIDQLNLESFVNLESWVRYLDDRVASLLASRCIDVLTAWTRQLRKDPTTESAQNGLSAPVVPMEEIQMTSVVHELRIKDQVIYLDPPLEMTQSLWLKQCTRIVTCVASQSRLRGSRYDLSSTFLPASQRAGTYLNTILAGDQECLETAVKAIHIKIQDMKAYIAKWLQFQALWDLDQDTVYERLGDDLESWAELLQEIRRTRSTFDTVGTRKSFGVCLVDYATIQAKVNAKYDAWQRDIVGRYGQKLGAVMILANGAIAKGRRDLERRDVNTSTTAEAVEFITFVEDLKRKRASWGPSIRSFQDGQRVLERQRYVFTDDWLHADQVVGEWTAFNEILGRKDGSIQVQVSGLQLKILAEDGIVHDKLKILEREWSQDKPIQGSVKPEHATESISIFEGRIGRLRQEQELIWRAKEALRMSFLRDDRLTVIGEEARDLKAVWTALSATWAQLQQLRETAWTAIQPRKLRQAIDNMAGALRELPSRMRQYAAYEYAQERLRDLVKHNAVVTELRSEAMRERHWQEIYRNLRAGQIYRPNNFSLGNVYDLDLKRHEKLLKDIVLQAQGEIALEEFLRQVRTTWEGYSLELINYQNKCRIIKGWDDLFTKSRDHLSSLNAMQASPYYRVFQDEAAGFEDKLNKTHVLFDVWIDVQRQWVYLEGIFSGNADIKQLLPVEASRFSNINAELMGVLKTVYKSPLVFDVITVPNIQKTMEKLAGALVKTQKALGDYLERERTVFPRFYFLGDEDLLEIIGNAKDLGRVTKHLKKMFAGIVSVEFSEDLDSIVAMVSRDGEVVPLQPTVDLKHTPKVNEWLSKLENAMKHTLATDLVTAYRALQVFYTTETDLNADLFFAWLEAHPTQIILLAVQVAWTQLIETRLHAGQSMHAAIILIVSALDRLTSLVTTDIAPILRRKSEHLITEYVRQRDALRQLSKRDVGIIDDFEWLKHLRYNLNEGTKDVTTALRVSMADAVFTYGYEFLGAPEPLVQTPLTDRCYLTLTQALHTQLGGSPFGPAGTGKTESVKALGNKLGRYVLVFCCDDGFDFKAMGRIFLGISRVGAWGCFDEFNRLEERILSAVSQQIQTIQTGLAHSAGKLAAEIVLLGKRVPLNPDTGIFITMNPGYAGRSNLPDNLKKLFRGVSMSRPDQEIIAQVMLYSQGFRHAELLAAKVVPLFRLCLEQLSKQSHYDFGLRALKSVLIRAGMLKRDSPPAQADQVITVELEQGMLIRSVQESVGPKLYASDASLLSDLISDLFPGVAPAPLNLDPLIKVVNDVCRERQLEPEPAWLEKVVQLYQVQRINHGIMLVGPHATGKTQVWTVLLESLKRWERKEVVSHVIDPKAMDKDRLYGQLDSTTREWTDGLVTQILRRIIDNARGESSKRHWIVFDGDVDPIWVENLNSVLDDNKLLTLPNGERLAVPDNVRFIFEVETLRYATLATVSRCGMIWFHGSVVSYDMLVSHHLRDFLMPPVTSNAEAIEVGGALPRSSVVQIREVAHEVVSPLLQADGYITRTIQLAAIEEHIMPFSNARALLTLFSLLKRVCRTVAEYNSDHADFPLSEESIRTFLRKKVLLCVVWAVAGDAAAKCRGRIASFIVRESGVDVVANAGHSLLDYDVDLTSGRWYTWQSHVPEVSIETHQVSSPEVVIPTSDTLRHEDVLYSWISERQPLILCGPPGSGKTMTLNNALRKLPDVQLSGLNFSSATSPELVLKNFEQYCDYRKSLKGVILAPKQAGKWLVVFCDEINLPSPDIYGTQRVISFMRQMVERGGFWRTSDLSWVTLERIQFVGACNPPTDPGRSALSSRFLRHAPVLFVGYPGAESLTQIYSSLARAALKVCPGLRTYAGALTDAMIELYQISRDRFTPEMQAHYVYSPRELSRWIRGIYEVIKPQENLDIEGLVRIWAHEAQRLFQDRLVDPVDKTWTDEIIDIIAARHFPGLDQARSLSRPILFSNWTTLQYLPVDRDSLRDYTAARLRTFYEEELDVPLVLFDDFLDHVLRIDRVFRQTQGHMLLIGVSGSGKTTMSRFVAWINGLTVFQIKVSSRYTAADFDDDLRQVLRRAGCKAEKICFILDESNILESSFLERMNTLLANSEVPGLFEGDDFVSLMTACREGSQRDGQMLDTQEELYRWFSEQIGRNLHVVFTMNPPDKGLGDKAATSPALFNRCVLDWFGDWSDTALEQVALELTAGLDLEDTAFDQEQIKSAAAGVIGPTHRLSVVRTMVDVHTSIKRMAIRHSETAHACAMHITPRHFLEYLQQYSNIFMSKRTEFEEQQRHLNGGLEKLSMTVADVEAMRGDLASKDKDLTAKEAEGKAKLAQMLRNQQIAEAKRREDLEIKERIKQQNSAIDRRRNVAEADLAQAEPAVRSAAEAVSAIKKQQLAEVRNLPYPPEAIKLTLEATCVMLGTLPKDLSTNDRWKTVRSLTGGDGFLSSITNFRAADLRPEARQRLVRDYLDHPSFTREAVHKAYRACTPLVDWVRAQLAYSEILDQVGPLREEIAQLQLEAAGLGDLSSEIETALRESEANIERYSEEYAALISQTEGIKGEKRRVEGKVIRSSRLLASLSSEESRWASQNALFASEMLTIPGDVLIASAFQAYAGGFDQTSRGRLLLTWKDRLTQARLRFRPDLLILEYLSDPDQRAVWARDGLPDDPLCVENAIMLSRFIRYPFIIDPSLQADNFLQNSYKGRRMIVTSFLDPAFSKNLESALRFGTPIYVRDVERIDPVLNTVLNREIRRTGGRQLIRLGNQDIDFSPAFTIFLSTRDIGVRLEADLCSRVTLVNFSLTPASLETQSLSRVLRAERPETEARRTDLHRLQGEFRLRLRQLERALLEALSGTTGNILDDDQLLATLEKLKTESASISEKVVETASVIGEIESVTAEYKPIAQACSWLFSALGSLSELNHFYQYSLSYFNGCFEQALLHNPSLTGLRDHSARAEVILRSLVFECYRRTASSVKQEDRAVLAGLFSQIYSRAKGEQQEMGSMRNLSEPSKQSRLPETIQGETWLTAERRQRLESMPGDEATAIFASLEADGAAWREICASSSPMQVSATLLPSLQASSRFAALSHLRPDKAEQAVFGLASSILGVEVDGSALLHLAEIISLEGNALTPFVLCAQAGHDATSDLNALIQSGGKVCAQVAMGSEECFDLADQAMTAASREGSWVVLRNTHLAPAWLDKLHKRIQSMNAHPKFRLFLAMEMHPSIPVALLQNSRVYMSEPAAGLKAGLIQALENPTSGLADAWPAEGGRLLFLQAWLHAILQERRRFTPLGWTKAYDFNESDFTSAVVTMDHWLTMAAKGRANIDPVSIPWPAIKLLLKQAVYGGRIDVDHDQRAADALVDKLFQPEAYDSAFSLVDTDTPLKMPEITSRHQFMEFAASLPDAVPCTWFGLPANAETTLAAAQGLALLARLRKVQAAGQDVAPKVDEDDKDTSTASWQQTLGPQATLWLGKVLPSDHVLSESNSFPADSSLLRFWRREYGDASALLSTVRRDLQDIADVCSGGETMTNALRALTSDLMKGDVPKSWQQYKYPSTLNASTWILDFSARLTHMRDVANPAQQDGSGESAVQLGKLLNPDAWLTATQQMTAHGEGIALEKLKLVLSVGQSDETDDGHGGFAIEGLLVQGGQVSDGALHLNDGTSTAVDSTRIRWITEKPSRLQSGPKITLPVFLNGERRHQLFNVEIPLAEGLTEGRVLLSGCAFLAGN